MAQKKETLVKNIEGSLYIGNKIVGHAPFPEVQIDTLSYQPLSDKVIGILTGNPNFTSEEINEEYDEESGEWEDANDDIEVDSIDEYTDKSDVFDLKNDLNQKFESVKHTQVEEGKNQSSEDKQKLETTNKEEETKQE